MSPADTPFHSTRHGPTMPGGRVWHTDGCPRLVIATILPRRGSTGVQSHFNVLEAHLLKTGRLVTFVNPRSHSRLAAVPFLAVRRLIEPLSGRASVWWYRRWHYELLRWALAAVLRDGVPGVVYAQCPLSALAAARARVSQEQRVVMAVHFSHSQADEWAAKGRIAIGDPIYRGIKAVERTAFRSVDAVVYPSRYMKVHLEREAPSLAAARSIVVPNFVTDIDGPGSGAADGVDGGAPSGDLITIGSLDRNKNQAYLVRVLAEAARIGTRYTLTVVGNGPERRRLEQLARELRVAGQITFLGHVPRARTLLARHRLYVHSALLENMPVSVIEALAAGLPVIAGAVGGVPEVVDESVGAFWDLQDPRAGALTLRSLAEDESRMLRAGEAARRRYEREFDAAVVAERLSSFLCEVGRGGPRQADASP